MSTTPDHGRWPDVPPTTPVRTLKGSLRRWPTAAGIGLAGFIAYDLSASDLSAGKPWPW